MGKNSFSLRDGEVQNITTRVNNGRIVIFKFKTYRVEEAPDMTFRTSN